MARNDGRIEPGQRISSAISARAWNRAQQAADIVLGVTPSVIADQATGSHSPYVWVYCKNQSGDNVAMWDVLSITGVAVAPTGTDTDAATTQFQAMPVMIGSSVSVSTMHGCVAVEPIAQNAIGRVAVSGAVQLKKSNLSKLINASVIWSDTYWCLVHLGTSVVVVEFSGEWAIGAAKTCAVKGTSNDITVHNLIVDIGVDCGTKKAIAAYVAGEWQLINAERR